MLGKKTVILTKIKKLVEDNLEINNISKKSRERDYVFARFLYFKIAKDCVETSLSNIASVVNRDHATAIHGIKQYDDLVKYNPGLSYLKNYYDKISSIIKSNFNNDLLDLSTTILKVDNMIEDLQQLKYSLHKISYEDKQDTIRQDNDEVANT
tara:strand:- start:717 stop:1175 length:459 start_codon:yes stop_codon:yes gene_type:complete